MNPRYPALFQINTRVWLNTLSGRPARPATLDDVPDGELDDLAQKGFDWIWLLGVWQTGEAGRLIARTKPDLLEEYLKALPDLREDDICGSCFAVTGYQVLEGLGGEAALQRFRERLRERGLKLLLDFVPNHTAPDHPWVFEHPEYYVQGSEEDLVRQPHNYAHARTTRGKLVLAYGRDPYFAGWSDTFQLNYANPDFQPVMIAELLKVAGLCDGVRCDMAMLVLPEVFERTWGLRPAPFWPTAIEQVRQVHPGFLFMAEVYWDLEWTMQQQGFDYAYDKRLYDRLRDGGAGAVRGHLRAGLDYQDKLARFLENHDEPRAAGTFPADVHRAAAVVTFLAPGLRFFHQGQFEGRQVRQPVQLCRAALEPVDSQLQAFYLRLLEALRREAVRAGEWQLLDPRPAWDGNASWEAFIAGAWQGKAQDCYLAVVNYAPHPAQCYLPLPFAGLAGRPIRLRDLLGPAVYDRPGEGLVQPGLYLDLPAWGYHLFELE